MSQGRLHGSRASAPEPCRCVSLGNVHPPDLRSIHPALTPVGNYTNKGTEYRPEGQPRRTEVHDFENKELGKVVPYGVYDLADNSGWVSVGVTSDTAEFAVNAIRSWFDKRGRDLYPAASRLMITADCGGSNGARVRLWKRELQDLADQTGLTISASRPELPSGTRSSTAFSAILRKTGGPAP